jgi:hypothetical protein
LTGGYFYITSLPIPAPKDEPQLFVWLVEINDIKHINIQLPRSSEGQAFIKEADRTWHFDDPQHTPVDMQRWGGGIPLLLSGPGADRVLYQETSEEKLAEFGLSDPLMEITLTLENDEIMVIKVGDNTPNTTNHYVQVPNSTAVALVDYTWYDVISSLVTDPPYIPAEEA